MRQFFAAEVKEISDEVFKEFSKKKLAQGIEYNSKEESEEALRKEGVKETRAQEEENKRILHELASDYYAKSKTPIGVNISMNNGSGKLSALTEKDKSKILLELRKFSKNSSEWQKKRIKYNGNLTIHVTHYPDKCVELPDYKSIKFRNWKFLNDCIAWNAKISKKKLQHLVSEKEEKLDKYRTYLKDVRLMLVADKRYGSGMIRLEGDNTLTTRSSFNEVYLFIMPDKVYKLNPPQ